MRQLNIKKSSDKRKTVLLSLAFLAVFIFILIGSARIETEKINKASQKNVKGASLKIENPVKQIRNVVEEKFENIQTDVKKIDVKDIATSSPQIQKIINDIKSIENYPSDQAKSLCDKICSSL